MLQKLNDNEYKNMYFDLFLHDDKIVHPHQYCEYFENLIGYNNQIYREKKIFGKKFKERNWVVRVYVNADNKYAETIVDIIEQIFSEANCVDYKSTLYPPVIKDRIIGEYTKPINNCICISGKFNTFTYKEIEYLDMDFRGMFWRGYMDMITPLIHFCTDQISFEVPISVLPIIIDYDKNIISRGGLRVRKISIKPIAGKDGFVSFTYAKKESEKKNNE